MKNHRILLNEKWTLEGRGPKNEKGQTYIKTTTNIPSHVHLALLDDGTIPDYNYRYNAEKCQWVETWAWTYSTTFHVGDLDSYKKADIVFEGLDTYAIIYINGVESAKTKNMFVSHRIHIGDLLTQGENEIKVEFTPIKEAIKGLPLENYQSAFTKDRVFTRRMQCTYTWDWVHRFVSYGIYKNVYIEIADEARIDEMYIATRNISDYSAQLYLKVSLENKTNDEFVLETSIYSPSNKLEVYEQTKVKNVDYEIFPSVENPELWWPCTHGDQPLYKVHIKLLKDDVLIDEVLEDFGIRTIFIEQITDKPDTKTAKMTKTLREKYIEFEGGNGELPGRSFTVLVNGKRIFLRGANWVPPSPFPAFDDDSRYERYVQLAKDGNINTLRVWGGGIYATEGLMKACDKMGVLVSQDFQFACGEFPVDDAEFVAELKKEFPAIIKELRNHPSLAWYIGDNELGMNEDFDNYDYSGRQIFDIVTRNAIRDNDIYREYIPTSPFGGRINSSATIGVSHYTCFMLDEIIRIRDTNQEDYIQYLGSRLSRYVDEAVSFGVPDMATLKMFMDDCDMDDNKMLNYHTKYHPYFKDFSFYEAAIMLADKWYGAFDCRENKYLTRAYIQYEWVNRLVKNHRVNKWYNSGILFWMYNDCWAASGWALTDWYGYPKAGYYGLKKASKTVIVSLVDKGDLYDVVVANDLYEVLDFDLECAICSLYADGKNYPLYSGEHKIGMGTADVVYQIDKSLIDGTLSNQNVLTVKIKGKDFEDIDIENYAMPKDLELKDANIILERQGTDEGVLTISTDNYARMVCLQGDYDFDDNYFDLLPNTKVTIEYSKATNAFSRNLGSEIRCFALNKANTTEFI